MPIIQVQMMEGRTAAQKERMIEAITEAIVLSLDAPKASVRVLIHELPKAHFGIGGESVEKRDQKRE